MGPGIVSRAQPRSGPSGGSVADITPSSPRQRSLVLLCRTLLASGKSSKLSSLVLREFMSPQPGGPPRDSLHNSFTLMLSCLLSSLADPPSQRGNTARIFEPQDLPVTTRAQLAKRAGSQYAYNNPPSCPDLRSFRFVAMSQNLRIQTQTTTPAVNPASTDMPITYPGSCDLGNKYGV